MEKVGVSVTEPLGVRDTVLQAEPEGVPDFTPVVEGLPEDVDRGERVGVKVEEREGVREAETVRLGVPEGVKVGVKELEGEMVGKKEGVEAVDRVFLGVSVRESVGLPLVERDTVGDVEGVLFTVPVGVENREMEALEEAVAHPVELPEPE